MKELLKDYKRMCKSQEYEEYLRKRSEETKAIHIEYIKNEKSEWKGRDDFFQEGVITKVTILDILSNSGINKLLRRLYSLASNKKFKVNNYYKKPGRRKEVNYIDFDYSSTAYGIFSEIKLLKDPYIEEIRVSWTKINNYYGAFEYSFEFKKYITDEDIKILICNSEDIFTDKDYVYNYYFHMKNHYHNYDENKEREFKFFIFEDLEPRFLSLYCQHYITTYLYSEYGSTNKLINLTTIFRNEKIEMDKMYFSDFCYTLYNKRSNYYISHYETDRNEDYFLFTSSENFSIIPSLARYGNELYYIFFGERELRIYGEEFSRYVVDVKNIRYNDKFLNLLKKAQSISEIDNRYIDTNNLKENLKENWILFYANDEVKWEEIFNKDLSHYQKVVNENYSYLKILSEMNYTKINIKIARFSLIVAVVAIIISIFSQEIKQVISWFYQLIQNNSC